MTSDFKKTVSVACIGFLTLSGIKSLARITADGYNMSKDLKEHYSQTDLDERINAFNVAELVTYDFEQFTHEVFSSFVFPNSNMESEIPIPEGYVIKTYNINKVEKDGKIGYVYNVTYINNVKVTITGKYDYKLNCIIYDEFGIPNKESKGLKLSNK